MRTNPLLAAAILVVSLMSGCLSAAWVGSGEDHQLSIPVLAAALDPLMVKPWVL